MRSRIRPKRAQRVTLPVALSGALALAALSCAGNAPPAAKGPTPEKIGTCREDPSSEPQAETAGPPQASSSDCTGTAPAQAAATTAPEPPPAPRPGP